MCIGISTPSHPQTQNFPSINKNHQNRHFQENEHLFHFFAEKRSFQNTQTLLDALREQKAMKMKGSIYHKTQIDLTYNSNNIEGSRLTHEQTRYIFETNTIGVTADETLNVNDIVETVNQRSTK